MPATKGGDCVEIGSVILKLTFIFACLLGGVGLGGVMVRGGARSNNAVVLLIGLAVALGGLVMAWAGIMVLIGATGR